MKRLVSLFCALAGAAACGDNLTPGGGGDDQDAVQVDAPNPDAPTDAPTDASIDAAPPRFTGTITLIEGSVLNPGTTGTPTVFGQGIQLGITFNDATMSVPLVLDTMPGSLFGCKVSEFTLAQVASTAVTGVNEGNVQVTVANGGTPATDPTYPPCVYTGATTGYQCPDLTSSQAITVTNSVTLTMLSASASRIDVNAGTATFALDDIGRYVKFSGTLVASLDASFAAFPIVAAGAACTAIIGSACAANQAIVGLPLPVATLPLTMGSVTTLGGVGPFPMLPDPGQLGDAASATAVLTPGGGNNFPATTVTFGNVGDDFTLDDTNANILRNIPRDGSAFTITCGTCAGAVGTVLNITTTDANLTGITSPFAMPPPATKRTVIRCAALGTSVTVPAAASAFIMSSGATRIQANFVRANFGTPVPANEGLTAVIGGHAIVGFTQVP